MIYSFEHITKRPAGMKLIKAFCSFFVLGLFLVPNNVSATHIVGGEMTYRCIANWTFEVTLTVRRDCEFGADEAQFDTNASVGIFDSNGQLLPWLGVGGQLLIPFSGQDTLESDLVAGCDFLGDPVCVHESTYVDTITLPFRPGGYILAYQRCCRNESLTNILNPVETGSEYLVRLTNKAAIECNNSPTFDVLPEIYICRDEELAADLSATDLDGDSLVYRLCIPGSGASIDMPLPQPPRGNLFNEVEYAAPYSLIDLMGGNPLSIDPNTGILTGTPNQVGQFLIGVCVDEYRDGELISSIKRDFEYNVRECIEGPEVSFTLEDEPECDGLEVAFTNTSTSTDTYFWYFDYPNTDPAFTSEEESPIFTYSGNGIYTVKLVSTRSSDGCFDEFVKDIGVYDSKLAASFTYEVKGCEPDSSSVTLTSTSVEPDSLFDIISHDWTFVYEDFSATATGEEVTLNLPRVDDVVVTLTVTSENGCTDTFTDFVDSDPVELDLTGAGDTIKLCFGDTIALVIEGNPEWDYTWTPIEGLIFTDGDLSNPLFTLAEDQDMMSYFVSVTDGVCSKEDTVVIMLKPNIAPTVLDFTSDLDCGTLTVCFENISDPLDGQYIFDFGDGSSEEDFSTEDAICYTYPDFGTYDVSLEYLGACDEFIIEKSVSVTPDITISTIDSLVYCEGEPVVLGVDTDQTDITVSWTDESGEVVGDGIEVEINPVGDKVITVIATNAGGCADTSTIVLDEYVFDLTVNSPEVACKGEDTVLSITDNAGDDLSYVWEPSSAIVGSNTDTSITINITEDTDIMVTVTHNVFGCVFTDIINMIVSDVSADIESDPEEVFQCNPAEISVTDPDPSYTYVWNTGATTESFISDTLLETTTFSVTVTDEFGCTATATKSVTVLLPQCDESDVFLPTAFTPNGDGMNDILKVESNFVKSMRLIIYNRWGEKVFESTNQDIGWDGTFDGAELAPDVYAYAFSATCSNGENFQSQGNITLIR